MLRYGPANVEDECGGLGEKPLGDRDEWTAYEIAASARRGYLRALAMRPHDHRTAKFNALHPA